MNPSVYANHDINGEFIPVKPAVDNIVNDWEIKNGISQYTNSGSNRVAEGFNVYFDGSFVEAAYSTSHQVSGGGFGCYEVSAFDASTPSIAESGLSNDVCVEEVTCVTGDASNDGNVKVSDIVMLVMAILNNGGSPDGIECADMDEGGMINVSDIVSVINIILNPMALNTQATEARLNQGSEVSLTSNGQISAIQMVLSHDRDFALELTQDAWVSDYKTVDNKTTLIVVMPNSDYLFTPSGEYTIEESIVLNSTNEIDVTFNAIPVEFSVSNAYPNPFNPVTAINISLPEDNMVNVNVYNVAGQMIDAVFSNNLTAGSHSISWDASNLSSGVYLIRTEAGKNISTQKVMLLK